MTIANAIEQIFVCVACGSTRQYGLAANLSDAPVNTAPFLRCATCRRATEHRYVANQSRSDARERAVYNEFKTYIGAFANRYRNRLAQ